MSDELKIMKGDCIEILLCKKKIKVAKLSISRQLDLIDMWSKVSTKQDKKQEMRETASFMIGIVSFITGIDKDEIDQHADFDEVVTAFGILYKRELLPLLLGAGKMKDILANQK